MPEGLEAGIYAPGDGRPDRLPAVVTATLTPVISAVTAPVVVVIGVADVAVELQLQPAEALPVCAASSAG